MNTHVRRLATHIYVHHLDLQVALVDPSLCMTLSKEQTVAMALTALSSCFDALIACELGSTDASPVINIGSLEDLSLRGIAAIGTALPKVLEREDIKARELLSMASLWAGQLSSATPAPPTQVRVLGEGLKAASSSVRIRDSGDPAFYAVFKARALFPCMMSLCRRPSFRGVFFPSLAECVMISDCLPPQCSSLA